MRLLPNTSLLALRNFYGNCFVAILSEREASGKQQLHQVEADSSVQNSLPIPRLPVLLWEILTADASSRNLAPERTCRTSRSRSRKTRLLQYSSWVRKATCRQELFCKRRHSAHEASEVIPAKRWRQDRAGRKQSRQGRTRKQERAGRKQSRKGRTHRSRSSQLEDQVRYQKPRRKLQLWDSPSGEMAVAEAEVPEDLPPGKRSRTEAKEEDVEMDVPEEEPQEEAPQERIHKMHKCQQLKKHLILEMLTLMMFLRLAPPGCNEQTFF